jgi:MFS family permease
MLSLSSAYYQIFLTQGVGFGIAASGLFSCGIVSVGQWFHKRKALALGVVLAGSSTGNFSAPCWEISALTSCRRCRSSSLPTLSYSKDWLSECYSSQRSRCRYFRLAFLLTYADKVAEEEVGC